MIQRQLLKKVVLKRYINIIKLLLFIVLFLLINDTTNNLLLLGVTSTSLLNDYYYYTVHGKTRVACINNDSFKTKRIIHTNTKNNNKNKNNNNNNLITNKKHRVVLDCFTVQVFHKIRGGELSVTSTQQQVVPTTTTTTLDSRDVDETVLNYNTNDNDDDDDDTIIVDAIDTFQEEVQSIGTQYQCETRDIFKLLQQEIITGLVASKKESSDTKVTTISHDDDDDDDETDDGNENKQSILHSTIETGTNIIKTDHSNIIDWDDDLINDNEYTEHQTVPVQQQQQASSSSLLSRLVSFSIPILMGNKKVNNNTTSTYQLDDKDDGSTVDELLHNNEYDNNTIIEYDIDNTNVTTTTTTISNDDVTILTTEEEEESSSSLLSFVDDENDNININNSGELELLNDNETQQRSSLSFISFLKSFKKQTPTTSTTTTTTPAVVELVINNDDNDEDSTNNINDTLYQTNNYSTESDDITMTSKTKTNNNIVDLHGSYLTNFTNVNGINNIDTGLIDDADDQPIETKTSSTTELLVPISLTSKQLSRTNKTGLDARELINALLPSTRTRKLVKLLLLAVLFLALNAAIRTLVEMIVLKYATVRRAT